MTQSSAAFHKAGLYSNSASFKWSSPSEIGRAGSRACAAARARGQVWRPWRCAAACKIQKRNLATLVGCDCEVRARAEPEARGPWAMRAHLPLATGPR